MKTFFISIFAIVVHLPSVSIWFMAWSIGMHLIEHNDWAEIRVSYLIGYPIIYVCCGYEGEISLMSVHKSGLWYFGITPNLFIWPFRTSEWSKWTSHSGCSDFWLKVANYLATPSLCAYALSTFFRACLTCDWGGLKPILKPFDIPDVETQLAPAQLRDLHSANNNGVVMVQASCETWIDIEHEAISCNH